MFKKWRDGIFRLGRFISTNSLSVPTFNCNPDNVCKRSCLPNNYQLCNSMEQCGKIYLKLFRPVTLTLQIFHIWCAMPMLERTPHKYPWSCWKARICGQFFPVRKPQLMQLWISTLMFTIFGSDPLDSTVPYFASNLPDGTTVLKWGIVVTV